MSEIQLTWPFVTAELFAELADKRWFMIKKFYKLKIVIEINLDERFR